MRALFTMQQAGGSSAGAAGVVTRVVATIRAVRSRGADAGMATAEYAVGTVAACGFGGVLYKLLTSETVLKLLTSVIKRAFSISF
jgi:hypothetical protein